MAEKSVGLALRLDVYTRARLEVLARRDDRSLTNMIERLIAVAYRDLQKTEPDLPDDPVLVNGTVVSERDLLGE